MSLAPRRAGADRGSILFLFPAAALCVLILAAVAVDLALLQVRTRELWAIADAAANDAASYALDQPTLRATGELRLDPELAAEAAVAAAGGSALAGVRVVRVEVGGDGRDVTVVLERDVELVVARNLPGGGTRTLRATASARLETAAPA